MRGKFADQLPTALQDMAGAMRGGRSFSGALNAVIDGAPEPIRGEFEQVVGDEQLGRPIEVSLNAVADRMHSEDMQQVGLVAVLHRQSGSSVAEALEHVAEGARERAELLRELASLTGQAKLTSRLLTGLPIVLFIALTAISPQYARPLTHTVGGIVVIVFCSLLITLGWWVMRRIVRVEA
jgi:tight adherence protein B